MIGNERVRRNPDRIPPGIACIDSGTTPGMLISTKGYHCAVWQCTALVLGEDGTTRRDVVVKMHLEPCTDAEVRVLYREYLALREALADIVPEALFVVTQVGGAPGTIAIAETVEPWFNIANPVNEAEAIPLLRRLPKAQVQLECFLEAARRWRRDEAKVVDLYGDDNLVLDRRLGVRYIDSFRVFFYEDLLYALDEKDEALQHKIELSIRRLEYLQDLLDQVRIACVGA